MRSCVKEVSKARFSFASWVVGCQTRGKVTWRVSRQGCHVVRIGRENKVDSWEKFGSQ